MAKQVWTPREVDSYVQSVKASLQKLVEGKYSYREAHTHVRTDRRDAIRTDENQGLRISNSHVSDPTGELVVSQEANRERLRQASELLEAAAKDIDAAVARVRDVFSSRDDYFQPLKAYGR